MKINYDIVNYKKFNWYDTQAYKFNRDDNNGCGIYNSARKMKMVMNF